MATNLGTLTLNLVAQTGSYNQGLQRAERQTVQSTENMSESFDIVGSSVAALSGLIAGISVASITALAVEAINTGNEIKKLADLSNASTQQFQYYAVGAKTAGIELEQFADQMKDMQDRIGDFQQTGGGPLADFFTNIAPLVGVTIDQFQKLSGPDAIQLFYSSLQKVFATENDIKFYMEAIISDSSKLIPLLRDGGKGFKEWGDRAKEAGAIMSDSMIQQMSEAKDNLQTYDLQWQGLKTTLINEALPAITGVIKNIDVLTSVLTVGGAFLVGAYIPTIYAATTAIIEKTNVQLADMRATQLSNEITAHRAARILHLTEIELNNARAQAARMAGMARLAFIEKTLIPLEQQHTAALAANTAAQNANNASKSMAITVGRGLLGVLGGPVGLGILVAGAAASYLLLRDNTDKATKSLNENGAAVDDVVSQYQQLTEAQQRNQLRAETDSLIELTSKYKDAKDELVALTLNLYRSGEASSDIAKQISQLGLEYKNGQISAETLAAKINKLNGVSAEGKAKIDAQTGAVKLANEEMSQQKSITQAMIQENLKLADSHGKVAEKISKQAIEMYKLTSEQRSYVNQVQADTLREKFIQDQVRNGIARDRAEFQANAYASAKVDLSKPNQIPNLVVEAEKQAWAIERASKIREEAEKKADEVAKKRESDRSKALNEAEKLREKQYQDREDIYYKYATREMKIEKDLQIELKKIREAEFPNQKMQAGYIDNAESRSALEILLYKAQLDAELKEWKNSEQEKLNHKVYINELMIQLDSDMNEEQKKLAIQSLIGRSNQELAWIRLEQQQRLLDSRQFYMSDAEYMQERYRLERLELEKINDLNERNTLLAIKYAEEEFEKRKNLKDASMAWGQSYADMTGSGARFQLERDRFDRYDESQDLFDSQMALAETAAEREAIWKAHNDRMRLIDEDYWNRTKSYQLGMAADVFGGLSGVMLNFVDESSSSYRALVAIQKGANLASVLMNSVTAISAAWASAPFPYNMPAVAMATLETGALQATLQAFTPQGFANGGYTGAGGKYDPAGIVHKGEVVFSQADIARWGGVGNVEAMRTGKGFADGGVVDTKVLDMSNNQAISGYLSDRQTANEQASNTADAINQFTINNFIDPKEIPQAMANPYGAKVFMNFIKLHKSTIRGMLGVP
ncbi:hypothetical protein [Acinetobacter higginsii]|uniref:hypothetical protein n=1 Tax=Acinetobacter higginsii TaxID=70347 RepID=UPI001F4BB725|nr:hypothetical protein [Acinetobacter higginsii]MCH7379321.1 hypothetical protein [Acinetobacter higginsii]